MMQTGGSRDSKASGCFNILLMTINLGKNKDFVAGFFQPPDLASMQNPRSSFSEKIEKDWETMAAVFSDHSSIFVTTYESRIDLMRVCIAGLEGTPYCYGLFFFDMFFPPEYPAKPPEIFYHAPDFDLSPSLHQDGRVSLILLSLYQWFSPGDYGDFVLGHFRKKAHRILLIYKDQMLKYKGDNGMKQLFFKLVKAFEINGAHWQHHCSKTEVEQLKRERLKTGDFPWKNVPNEEHVSNFT
ncbi:hypothetical protein POTOM_045596 [Populus tomentosa]|uniref:UBC core domain-containing protein n=1 Tax=Populus tomentosa TaxID=118781 RepID=A0A8X7YH74_POPTO|nr:hypothetical protein POTOM_045596 [Populus tomentosa]